MNYRRKVVVIDGSKQMHNYYASLLEHTDYAIIGNAFDGRNGLTLIRELEPDIVVMELILTHLDGLELLERINTDKSILLKPETLVVSAVGRDDMVEKAFTRGAGYYMLKPVERELFLRRLDQLYLQKSMRSPAISEKADKDINSSINMPGIEENITDLLRAVGLPSHIRGFQYLRDSIMIVVENKEQLNALTKVLYPAVARMNNTTGISVERAIRHGIDVIFRKEHTQTLEDLFGYKFTNEGKKPTTAEFIAVLADRIRLTSHITS